MKTISFALALTSFTLLGACSSIDTTGIHAESSRLPQGPSSAFVTVTEYGDLQCPACKGAHELLNKPLLEKFGGNIRFEFKHFPLRALHPHAFRAAQASECAADQGKFWEYVDMDYKNQADLPKDPHKAWATALGLDTDLFMRCLDSGIKGDTVLADYAQGEKLGVNSTPTYFVNGVKVSVNSLEDLTNVVQSALSASSNTPL